MTEEVSPTFMQSYVRMTTINYRSLNLHDTSQQNETVPTMDEKLHSWQCKEKHRRDIC